MMLCRTRPAVGVPIESRSDQDRDSMGGTLTTAGTMGMVRGCALRGDNISSSSSHVCMCMCVGVWNPSGMCVHQGGDAVA